MKDILPLQNIETLISYNFQFGVSGPKNQKLAIGYRPCSTRWSKECVGSLVHFVGSLVRSKRRIRGYQVAQFIKFQGVTKIFQEIDLDEDAEKGIENDNSIEYLSLILCSGLIFVPVIFLKTLEEG